MATRKFDAKKAEQKTKDAHQLLQDGLSQFIDSDGWQQYLQKQAAFHDYSARNVMLILSQNPDASHCAGYRAWQKMNRQVRKGQKGLMIFAPMVFRKAGGDDDDTYVRFRVTTTFDISQTDGEPLEAGLPSSELVGGDAGLYSLLQQFSESRGVPVEEKECGSANGRCFYNSDGTPKLIWIDPNQPLANRIKTLLHEIGHSVMHTLKGYRTHSETSRIEMEAESFAFIMSHHFEIDSSSYSFRYLASWSEDDDPTKIIQEIGGTVQRAAKEAIGEIDAMVEENTKSSVPLAA